MNMLWKIVEPKYVANPVLARALDILFILHADHEQRGRGGSSQVRISMRTAHGTDHVGAALVAAKSIQRSDLHLRCL